MKPIYDVNRGGYGTGFNLSLAGAKSYQAVHGGDLMVSCDGGRTWNAYEEARDGE